MNNPNLKTHIQRYRKALDHQSLVILFFGTVAVQSAISYFRTYVGLPKSLSDLLLIGLILMVMVGLIGSIYPKVSKPMKAGHKASLFPQDSLQAKDYDASERSARKEAPVYFFGFAFGYWVLSLMLAVIDLFGCVPVFGANLFGS